MTRATTPIITFRFTTDYSQSDAIQLTFSQNGKPVVVLGKSDMSFSTQTIGEVTYYTVAVTLTQEQTICFTDRSPAEVQFRIKNGETVFSSNIKSVDVNRILNDEVM